ncbi:DnaJ C-terminal domain-containing protein [Geminicoccus roseus]|uniref:DnaJ C-terminal domain-containing protein n=1 Tax=Geminicoccus roseus TaxID=404900 RepID=UPI0003F69CF8|nr:DnaJ C-terminal domain-containing protein [Geminicoccus roseus]
MDPYQVLGVAKDAAPSDIRAAYRKLAKEFHPDLNPGSKAAEDRFKEVSAAYDLLNDPDKRARFDRGEIDATGAERPQQRSYRHYADAEQGGRYGSASGFEDLSGVFGDLFGRQRGNANFRARGRDAHYSLAVAFLDAANGGKQRITLPDGQTLDVTIPAGIKDGDVLRLSGKGMPGIGGGPPGDALVEISVGTHPFFRLEGTDIVLDLPITIDEAVLGGQVEVPTISGRVKMNVPKGSSTGDVLRLKGKGVKPAGGMAGDQRIVLRVVMPKPVDDELASFLEKWRQSHGYDPRSDLRRTT